MSVAPAIVTGSPGSAGWSGPGRPALFLDRDGVINLDHGYVHRPEQTDWIPGIFELARCGFRAGFALVVVTNQAGIARGYYGVEQFEEYTRWIHARFADEGAPLLATYHCPHHPDAGFGALKLACGCRKPEPGMLLQAARDWSLDLEASILVGDKPGDLEAARRAGVGQAFQVGSPVDFGPVMSALSASAARAGKGETRCGSSGGA